MSVVIPTYDREGLVLEAVASVRAQGLPVLEILVVDDGSTDATAARVAALGPPVEVVRLAHSGCPGRVRNEGIRRARGEYLAFLDADDLWLPGKLTRQLAFLAAHPDLRAVYADEYFEERGHRLSRTRFDDFPPRRRLLFPDRAARLSVQLSSLLVAREVIERVGGFHDDLCRYEDAEFVGRISEAYALGFVEEPLVVYRLGADGLHLTADDRLRVREGRRYLGLWRTRRGDRLTREEASAMRRFEGELEAIERHLAGGRPPDEHAASARHG